MSYIYLNDSPILMEEKTTSLLLYFDYSLLWMYSKCDFYFNFNF